jgi:putative DNA primase/helicase
VAPAPPGTPLKPRFAKFLSDITGGDVDFVRTLRMWFGISASGTSRDQRILFLYGSGGNGKGVLLRTVSNLLGSHAVTAPRDLLMLEKYSQHATHLIDVARARMAIATEVADDATWDVALMKDLTGGDQISVNRMRQDPFRVDARCSITISGNRKPALKEVDEAVRRRFIMATFVLKVAKEDVIADLEKQYIAEEGPEILRWIIDGAVDREMTGALYVASSITDDTAEYLSEEDITADFATQTYRLDPGKRLKSSEMYLDWRAFCDLRGRKPGSQNAFTTRMKAAGFTYKRTEEGRYFLDLSRVYGGY